MKSITAIYCATHWLRVYSVCSVTCGLWSEGRHTNTDTDTLHSTGQGLSQQHIIPYIATKVNYYKRL